MKKIWGIILSFIILSSSTILIIANSYDTHKLASSKIENFHTKSLFMPTKDPKYEYNIPSFYANANVSHSFQISNLKIVGNPISQYNNYISDFDFLNLVSKSDDAYASVNPIEKITKGNFHFLPFIDDIGNKIIIPISPSYSSYISFDNLTPSSDSYISNDTNQDEIYSQFYIGDNDLLYPNGDYVEISSNKNTSSAILSVNGFTISENIIKSFYNILNNGRDLIRNYIKKDEEIYWPKVLLSGYVNETFYDLSILTALLNIKNIDFFRWFIDSCFSYNTLKQKLQYRNLYLDLDASEINMIKTKFFIYLYSPINDNAYPSIINYTLQCYNFAAEKWDNIFTGKRTPNLNFTNTWLYNYIEIDNGHNYFDHGIKYRIIVQSNRDSDDTKPLTFRIGGLWSSIETINKIYEISGQFSPPCNISKNDITSASLILEYHTNENFQYNKPSSVMSIYIDYLYHDDYDRPIYLQNLLAKPIYTNIYDKILKISIPKTLMDMNGTIKFNISVRTPISSGAKLYFDQISMQYAYSSQIKIDRKAFVDPTTPIVYIYYEVNIIYSIQNMELHYPSFWHFNDDDFMLIENVETGKNVSWIWKESIKDPYLEDLIQNNTIIINKNVLFYIGYGTFRFWFKSKNYAFYSSIYNSSYIEDYQELQYNKNINYNLTLSNFSSALNKENFDGNATLTFIGYDRYGKYNSEKKFEMNHIAFENVSGYKFWNNWSLSIIHNATDNLYGIIKVIFYWHNIDYTRFGTICRYIYLPYVSFSMPMVSFVYPLNNSYINGKNYIIGISWHLNTISMELKIGNNCINMKRATDFINSSELENFIKAPKYLWKLYWIATPNISYYKDFDYEHGKEINITMQSKALIGTNISYSKKIYILTNLITKPIFNLSPISNITIENKAKIIYYSGNLNSITIYLNMNTRTLKILTISNENNKESPYLFKGNHLIWLPYEFSQIGNYSITIEVEDNIGNIENYTSNTFYVLTNDNREWYLRIMDDTANLFYIWIAYTFGIIVYVKNKKNKKNLWEFKI